MHPRPPQSTPRRRWLPSGRRRRRRSGAGQGPHPAEGPHRAAAQRPAEAAAAPGGLYPRRSSLRLRFLHSIFSVGRTWPASSTKLAYLTTLATMFQSCTTSAASLTRPPSNPGPYLTFRVRALPDPVPLRVVDALGVPAAWKSELQDRTLECTPRGCRVLGSWTQRRPRYRLPASVSHIPCGGIHSSAVVRRQLYAAGSALVRRRSSEDFRHAWNQGIVHKRRTDQGWKVGGGGQGRWYNRFHLMRECLRIVPSSLRIWSDSRVPCIRTLAQGLRRMNTRIRLHASRRLAPAERVSAMTRRLFHAMRRRPPTKPRSTRSRSGRGSSRFWPTLQTVTL